MKSFEDLYRGLFPHASQDRLSNYIHVRLLKPPSERNTCQIDVVRPILGPVCRKGGPTLCILKCISLPTNDSLGQTRLLREVAIHRAATLGSNPAETRTLPLLSHFLARSLFGRQETTSRKSANGKAFLVLVLPYCPRGTLFDFITLRLGGKPESDGERRTGTLREAELRWTIEEVASGLKRCHDRGIIHRDVKAENILLWEPGSSSKPSTAVPTGNTLQLLLCDFGLSTWLDEEQSEESADRGDSTLCGTWNYLSPETATQRRTGPAVDIWALGCLCVFLLTGSLPFAPRVEEEEASSSSDVRVKASSMQKRMEKLAVGDWEDVRARLPKELSYDCRAIIEAMLQVDCKDRLTLGRIFSHPFMKSSLPRMPLGRLEEVKMGEDSGKKRKDEMHGTPTEAGNSSSATLRSVMQRTSPGLFEEREESKTEKRRTPFGLVRICRENAEKEEKQKEEMVYEVTEEKQKGWGDGFGTRGLMSVRQRIHGGKVELTKDGQVVYTAEHTSIAISSDGAHFTVLSSTQPKGRWTGSHGEELYSRAARWLSRHRRKSTLVGFMLPAMDEGGGRDAKGDGAVGYVAYCSVKGNGPLPDYQVRFAAEEGRKGEETRRVEDWNVQVQVHVQRQEGIAVLHSQVHGAKKRGETSWKEGVVPIRRMASRWSLAASPRTSLVVEDLSRREHKAIERSLQAARLVDSVFETLSG